ARALINLEIVTEDPVGTISVLPVQDDVGVLEFNALEILRLLEAAGADLENGSSAVRLRVRESLRDLRGILRQVVGSHHRLAPRPQTPRKKEPRCHQDRQHGSGSKELSHQLEIEGHRPRSILNPAGPLHTANVELHIFSEISKRSEGSILLSISFG